MALTGFDANPVWTSDQPAREAIQNKNLVGDDGAYIKAFREFIHDFVLDNIYIYRERVMQQLRLKEYYLEVLLDHVEAFNHKLSTALRANPNAYLALFEQACQLVATERVGLINKNKDAPITVPDFQVILQSTSRAISIRSLTGDLIGQLVQISGIIISTSRNSAKATDLRIICKSCKHQKTVKCKPGFSSVMLPRSCENGSALDGDGVKVDCPPSPYVVLGDYCKFVDQQSLKLQENPETVPTGEMPRHVLLFSEKYLVGRVVPGTRVTVTGIYTIFQNKAAYKKRRGDTGAGAVAIRHPYLRVVGFSIDSQGIGRSLSSFKPGEETQFRQMARHPRFYEMVWKSVAPAIYGHHDIKKAIACLLFCGSRKSLPDGMRLRGDINVLLLGDPGTAKSQFLKFVEKVAPIAVYTSGKGSSAAGLTASVIKEQGSKQFYLEGGAMVLADGGVVCIDEFDKMHLHDRVAIHEAMEQQTISIAKAGITTILNSRTAVLAAANPVFGTYDDQRTPFENIEFQSTILSRFDMIFLVRDRKDVARDKLIAHHVVDVHMRSSDDTPQAQGEGDDELLDPSWLKRYIAFARSRCAPRLSEEGAAILQNHYVSLRTSIRKQDGSAVPITVRQLEAIVRISESLAKMTLSPVANKSHVEEAIRLFTVSTVQAAQSGQAAAENLPPEVWAEVEAIEGLLRRRIPIGSTILVKKIKDDLARHNFSAQAVGRAIDNLIGHQAFEWMAMQKKIRRIA